MATQHKRHRSIPDTSDETEGASKAAEATRRSRKSRRKGRKYQKKVCNELSIWWTGSIGNFRSTPGSGGWDKEMAPGDITPKKGFEEFPFTVECKKRKNIDFFATLRPKSEFWIWWGQSHYDSTQSGKIPLLIFAPDFGSSYIAYSPLILLQGFNTAWPSIKVTLEEFGTTVIINELNAFFEANKPTDPKEGRRQGYIRYRSSLEDKGEIRPIVLQRIRDQDRR